MANILITGANGSIASHVSKLMESSAIVSCPSRASVESVNKNDQRMSSTLRTRRATPAVLNYCYDAMTNILEAPKS